MEIPQLPEIPKVQDNSFYRWIILVQFIFMIAGGFWHFTTFNTQMKDLVVGQKSIIQVLANYNARLSADEVKIMNVTAATQRNEKSIKDVDAKIDRHIEANMNK